MIDSDPIEVVTDWHGRLPLVARGRSWGRRGSQSGRGRRGGGGQEKHGHGLGLGLAGGRVVGRGVLRLLRKSKQRI